MHTVSPLTRLLCALLSTVDLLYSCRMTRLNAHDAINVTMTSSGSLIMHDSLIMHERDLAQAHLGYVFGHARHADDTHFAWKRGQMSRNTLLVVKH